MVNKLTNDQSLADFLWALRQQESGGNYKVSNSAGALGAYQILSSNLPEWSQEALGKTVTPQEFLNNPGYQDAVAEKIAGGYFEKYGPQGAASAWYSGDPNLVNSTKPQPGGPSVSSYVSSVIGYMKQAPADLTLPLSGSTAASGGPTTDGGTSGGGDGSTVSQAGLLSIPGDIVNFFSAATTDLANTFSFFHALFQPSSLIRAGAGVFGFIFLIFALVFMYKETKNG